MELSEQAVSSSKKSTSKNKQLALPVDVGNIFSFGGGAVVGVALLFAVRKLYR